MPEQIETVIIGRGHAGLALSYSLTQRGHELDDVLGKLAEIGMRWEAEDAARRAVRATELKAAE